jgi:hypothetical protein
MFHSIVGVVGTSFGKKKMRANAAERWMQWLRSQQYPSPMENGMRALPDYVIREWEEVYGA